MRPWRPTASLLQFYWFYLGFSISWLGDVRSGPGVARCGHLGFRRAMGKPGTSIRGCCATSWQPAGFAPCGRTSPLRPDCVCSAAAFATATGSPVPVAADCRQSSQVNTPLRARRPTGGLSGLSAGLPSIRHPNCSTAKIEAKTAISADVALRKTRHSAGFAEFSASCQQTLMGVTKAMDGCGRHGVEGRRIPPSTGRQHGTARRFPWSSALWCRRSRWPAAIARSSARCTPLSVFPRMSCRTGP